MAVSGQRGCSSRTRTSRDGRVPGRGWRTTGATAKGGGCARCWHTGTPPDTGADGGRRHDGRGDRQVRVDVGGVRAHPGVDGEGRGRVVRRRARRDTDRRRALKSTPNTPGTELLSPLLWLQGPARHLEDRTFGSRMRRSRLAPSPARSFHPYSLECVEERFLEACTQDIGQLRI
jgi:hypothetical protein